MCNACCKEFQGWCRAFTATEVILSVLQAVLLTFLVVFLTFLILHLLVCSNDEVGTIPPNSLTAVTLDPAEWHTAAAHGHTDSPSGIGELDTSHGLAGENGQSTVPPDVECTWTPSAKTRAVSQYFEHVDTPTSTGDAPGGPGAAPPLYDEPMHTGAYDDGVFVSDRFDGELVDRERRFIMALAKVRPPNDVKFGCVLTVISEFWTLTAASCIESIEEVDSLDSFVMVENFGDLRNGKIHPVSDVLVHPQYQGTNGTFDIVALKSVDRLASGRDAPLKLPTVLDYQLIALGERLTILGFGKFRSVDRGPAARGARAVAVHVLPGGRCAARDDVWSARHLAGGAPAARAPCGVAAVCAGPLYARGVPCNYCAGTPLLQARTLLGLMTAPGPCGAPCEPALYVNLAASRDWLHDVVGDD